MMSQLASADIAINGLHSDRFLSFKTRKYTVWEETSPQGDPQRFSHRAERRNQWLPFGLRTLQCGPIPIQHATDAAQYPLKCLILTNLLSEHHHIGNTSARFDGIAHARLPWDTLKTYPFCANSGIVLRFWFSISIILLGIDFSRS